MAKAVRKALRTIGSGKPGRPSAGALGTRASPNRRPFLVPLLHQFKHRRSSHTLRHANMPALSSVLLTPSRDCKASVLHWKTRRLPVTDPSSLPLTPKWKRHKKIWTLSTHAGRNFKRKLTVSPLADCDGTALIDPSHLPEAGRSRHSITSHRRKTRTELGGHADGNRE